MKTVRMEENGLWDVTAKLQRMICNCKYTKRKMRIWKFQSASYKSEACKQIVLKTKILQQVLQKTKKKTIW